MKIPFTAYVTLKFSNSSHHLIPTHLPRSRVQQVKVKICAMNVPPPPPPSIVKNWGGRDRERATLSRKKRFGNEARLHE